MNSRTFRITAAAALMTAALAGCADQTPAASPPVATTTAPSSATPSDAPLPGWVVGTVSETGPGPCYGLLAEDGTRYAMHAPDGTKLIKDSLVRVQLGPARAKIACGEGKAVELIAAATPR